MPVKADMLTLADVMRVTGFDRSALKRYTDVPEIRDWLGAAETHPLYPEAMLPRLQHMYEMHKRGVSPRPFAISIQNDTSGIEYGPSSSTSTSETALATEVGAGGPPQDMPGGGMLARIPDNEALATIGQMLGDRFGAALVDAVRASNLLPAPAVPEDRFLTRDQAAQLLACKPSAVGRRLPPVVPETWSFLEIQAYMTVARERAAAARESRRK